MQLVDLFDKLDEKGKTKKQIYLTGLEHSVEHESFSKYVKNYFSNVDVAYDGLIFDFYAKL